MWERNGTAWARPIQSLTFRKSESNFITVKYCIYFLSRNMWVQLMSTMDQRWIHWHDGLWAPPLPPLAAPDDSLLELAPHSMRKRDRDKHTETEKRKNNHRNRERKREHLFLEKWNTSCWRNWESKKTTDNTRKCTFWRHPRRCKTSSVGQSARLLIPRSSVWFRQKLKKPRNQIYLIWAT